MVRWLEWVIFYLRFVLNLIPVLILLINVNHCQSGILFEGLLTTYCAFGKKLDASHMSCLFPDENIQHIPECTKMISSWIRED